MVLDQIRIPGKSPPGPQQLIEGQKDPEAELCPKVTVDTTGMIVSALGDIKTAIQFSNSIWRRIGTLPMQATTWQPPISPMDRRGFGNPDVWTTIGNQT
jgi:hypothetical protein